MVTKKTPPSKAPKIWQDYVNPPLDEVDAIVEKYHFHSLDRDAILEENQYARLDSYDDYLFLVLHFPKYDSGTERYIQNELNIFIAKEYLITFRYYQSRTIRKAYDRYEQNVMNGKENSSAFLLYDIIDNYLDKTMQMLERFGKDLKILERDLFQVQ